MGACDFECIAEGKTADEAFKNAVSEAQHRHGHGGYTGTIAEKHDYTVIDVPAGVDPHAYAQQLVQDGDPRIQDKWGPAGCIKLADGRYLFFGTASS